MKSTYLYYYTIISMNKDKRLSVGSTPLPEKNDIDISRSIEENSPIIVGAKRKISFSSDSESDDEVIFTKQANKRKKMSSQEELKVWFRKEFG